MKFCYLPYSIQSRGTFFPGDASRVEVSSYLCQGCQENIEALGQERKVRPLRAKGAENFLDLEINFMGHSISTYTP